MLFTNQRERTVSYIQILLNLINDAIFAAQNTQIQMWGAILMNGWEEWMLREVVVAYLKTLSRHFLEWTAQNQESFSQNSRFLVI